MTIFLDFSISGNNEGRLRLFCRKDKNSAEGGYFDGGTDF